MRVPGTRRAIQALVRASVAASVVSLAPLVVAAPARGEPWVVDGSRSEIVVVVFRAGVGSALAHDHVVRAADVSGTLEVDRTLGAVSGDIRVDTRTLAVDEPGDRAKHDVAGTLSAEDRAEVRATMLGAGQLDAERHPELRFRAAELDRAGDGYRLAGDLRIRGVTRRVSFPLRVAEEGDALRASGTLRFSQSEFGIEPYSALLGAVRNRDEVELRFDVVAVPASR